MSKHLTFEEAFLACSNGKAKTDVRRKQTCKDKHRCIILPSLNPLCTKACNSHMDAVSLGGNIIVLGAILLAFIAKS